MIGQKRLLEAIDSAISNGFPHSFILLGKEGCGKTTLLNEISSKLGIDVADLDGKLTFDEIDRCLMSPEPHIYRIDSTGMTQKEQNSLLKFLEEPSDTAYIAIECRNSSELLETVLNRCMIFEFDSYTEEELAGFGDKRLASFCTTPGMMSSMSMDIIDELGSMAEKLLHKDIAKKASLANTLSIKDKANAYGYEVFLRIVCMKALDICIKNDDLYADMISNQANITLGLIQKGNLNDDSLMNEFLCKVWELAKE